ncbi:MAG: hypothetical protein J6M03_07595 [Clostridia bacterium]|nr:hypothetical protein [Clostridia bacterium]
MKKRNSKHRTERPPTLKLIISSLYASLCGLICFFALILLLGGICLLAGNVHSLLFPLSLMAIYLSSFAAGFAAVILNRAEARALTSLLGGIGFTILLFLVLLPFSDDGEKVNILLKFVTIPISILGGYCAPKQNSRKRRRK